jgi:hypothetical protein
MFPVAIDLVGGDKEPGPVDEDVDPEEPEEAEGAVLERTCGSVCGGLGHGE